MSTSAVSSTSLYSQLQEYYQTRYSDLKQLGQALGSGDLAGAQSAYNNIVTLGQSGPFAGGNPFKINQREQDFNAIGQALQSGDLAGAQQAFSTLESTFIRTVGPQTPPSPTPVSSSGSEIIVNLSNNGGSTSPASGTGAASSSGPEIILNLGNNNGASSPEQITINISNPATSGAEQVSLIVGNQGSNGQEITFNLSPNSNEQIVLNLLNESSSPGSGGPSGGLSVSA
jgi:hypothetical protein